MEKFRISIEDSVSGDILASHIRNSKGLLMVARNTVMNDYIKGRLLEMGIVEVEVYVNDERAVAIQNEKARYQQVKADYKENIMSLKKIVGDLSLGKRLDIDKVENIAKIVYKQVNNDSQVIKWLSEIRNFDEYTYTHSINVSFYSMLIAKWLGLPEKEVLGVIQAGILHDIGKVRVDNMILNKRGKLLEQEYKEMKKHPVYGYELIKRFDDVNESIKRAILFHHERTNGSGYPFGLNGKSIDLSAKIVSVADVFDAMTSDRVYKKGVSPFEVFQMFSTVGAGQFDVKVVETFINNLAPDYIGSKVMMENGDIGEVVYIPPQDPANPIIQIGTAYIDLSRENDRKIQRVGG